MRMRCTFITLSLSLCLAGSAVLALGQSAPESSRTIVRKIVPIYPEFARRMDVAGTVKLYAVVAPDGKVKSVEVVGGSPVFIQAAKDAISQWKYAPAATETKELVELHFTPH